MKATELRIGNWIMMTEGATSKLIPQKATWNDMANIENFPALLCAPISLTEEWLLKFDFYNSKSGQITCYRHPESYILLSSDTEGGLDVGHEKHAALLANIKYVHQLQNLFFALRGKELELSEKAN